MSRIRKINKKTKNLAKKVLDYTLLFPNKTISNVLTTLIKLGLYKCIVEAKLFFIIAPFIFLIVVDNIVVSFIITTLNTFICSIVFLTANISREEAVVNGELDYGLYKYLLAKKQTKAIIICFALTMFNIFIGHFFVDKILNFGIDFL